MANRLLNAGASLRGTTNVDEFAFFTTGETCAHGRIENTASFNCSGNPALSVPSDAADNKPVGVQIVTDWNDEPTAFRVAQAIEQE